jgi:hypothetical protein
VGGAAGLSCHPGYRAGAGWVRFAQNLNTHVRKAVPVSEG